MFRLHDQASEEAQLPNTEISQTEKCQPMLQLTLAHPSSCPLLKQTVRSSSSAHNGHHCYEHDLAVNTACWVNTLMIAWISADSTDCKLSCELFCAHIAADNLPDTCLLWHASVT
ncbi:TPA: hypothetical protein ACH3X1_002274 [Trebouxia sp. C0004]